MTEPADPGPSSTGELTPAELANLVRSRAKESGFVLAGITPAVTPTGFSRLLEWLRRNYHGRMEYLSRDPVTRRHPESVLPGVRSIVMLAACYETAAPPALPASSGRVSRYAWGSEDYHHLLRRQLKQVAAVLHEHRPGCRTRGIVDTAPLLERDFARLAGLGWVGKNTMLISRYAGSWLFLAALLTDAELEPDSPHETSHCGTCTRCLDACPTDAFPEPHVLDARRCISYLTIELRDGPIPQELRPGMGEWLFGCDICQDVCPWNSKSRPVEEPAFQPAPGRATPDLIALLQLSPEELRRQFRKTPLERPGRKGLLRNAAIVLGNRGDQSAIPALISALTDEEPLIRGAAAWALGQLGGTVAASSLKRQELEEADEMVREEINSALNTLNTSAGNS